jgi:two-component sensor histidine kinase
MKFSNKAIFIFFYLAIFCIVNTNLSAQTGQPYIQNSTNPKLARLIELRRNNTDSALPFANQLLKEALANKDNWLECEVTLEMARIYFAKDDQKTSLDLSLKAEQHSTPKNAAYFNAPQFSAYLLNRMGKSEAALQKLFLCLKRTETSGANKMLPSINFTIADIYRENQNSAIAKGFAFQGLQQAKELKDTSQLVMAYNTLGNIYSNRDYRTDKNIDTAIAYYTKLVTPPLVNKWLKPYDSARDFCNMGRVYRIAGKFDLSSHYLDIALDVAERRNFKSVKQAILNEQLTLEKELGNLVRAGTLANQAALALPDSQTSVFRTRDLNQQTEDILQQTGDYEAAYNNLLKNTQLKDSLFNIEKQRAILEVEKKYEADTRVLKAVNLAQKKENERNIIIASSILFLGILLSYFLWNSYKRRKHAEFLKTLILEVNHRTKNNLQMLSVLISGTQNQLTDEQTKTDIKKLKSYIKSFAMMYENLNNTASFDTVNLSDYVTNVSNSAVSGSRVNDLSLEIKTERNIQLSTDKAILVGLIVNELITNSIKHAFPSGNEGKITINLFKKEEATLALSYEDNGTGQIASPSKTGSFGVNMIQQLVKQMKGSILYDTDNLKRVNIYFPAA